jgi:hypothetical protein
MSSARLINEPKQNLLNELNSSQVHTSQFQVVPEQIGPSVHLQPYTL